MSLLDTIYFYRRHCGPVQCRTIQQRPLLSRKVKARLSHCAWTSH